MTPTAINVPVVLDFELYRRTFKRIIRTPEVSDQDSYMLRRTELSDQDSYKLGNVNGPEQNTNSYHQAPVALLSYRSIRAVKSEVTLSANVEIVPMGNTTSIAELRAWSVFWHATASLFGILQIIRLWFVD